MPETEVRFYREADGSAPVLDWLDELAVGDRRAFLKCRELIERLGLFGHELRRPTADLLRDGVYELRARVGRVPDPVLLPRPERRVARAWVDEEGRSAGRGVDQSN
jgi:hypothetical protein